MGGEIIHAPQAFWAVRTGRTVSNSPRDRNAKCVNRSELLQRIDDLRLETIAEHHRELIHYDIPSLAPRPAIREVSNIQEQDLDHRIVIREHLASGDVLSHLRMQALNRIGGINDATEFDGIPEESSETVPMVAPGRNRHRVPLAPSLL